MTVILVVEDEVLTSEYLEFVLESAGYEAIPAGSAEEALAVLEHRDDIDLMVTDINLPGDMNGIALAALVRDRRPEIDIVVVTGYSPPTSDELPTGSLFVPKPYNAQKMIDAKGAPKGWNGYRAVGVTYPHGLAVSGVVCSDKECRISIQAKYSRGHR
jgi:CheY-like chemotaxis protein